MRPTRLPPPPHRKQFFLQVVACWGCCRDPPPKKNQKMKRYWGHCAHIKRTSMHINFGVIRAQSSKSKQPLIRLIHRVALKQSLPECRHLGPQDYAEDRTSVKQAANACQSAHQSNKLPTHVKAHINPHINPHINRTSIRTSIRTSTHTSTRNTVAALF